MLREMQTVCHLLEEGEDLVQAQIICHAGSTPRSVGSRMFIRRDGSVIGSIGGGLVEYQVQKLAREIFETGRARIEAVELTGSDAATTDRMICGGRLEILLEYLAPDSVTRNEVRTLVTTLQKANKGFLIKCLDVAKSGTGQAACCLVQKDAVACGSFPGDESWISLLVGEAARKKSPVIVALEGRRFFVEPAFLPGTVFLFGAGHVSRPVAGLAAMVDFSTVVIDDRSEFANSERFPLADRIIVTPSLDTVFEELEIDQDSYLVIVTRGHLHDKIVLEQALRTGAGYIGMIGSRRKQRLVYDELRGKGYGEDDLQRVCNPIGVDIGAETPEEIAVSIVAELIKARAQNGR